MPVVPSPRYESVNSPARFFPLYPRSLYSHPAPFSVSYALSVCHSRNHRVFHRPSDSAIISVRLTSAPRQPITPFAKRLEGIVRADARRDDDATRSRCSVRLIDCF